MNKPVIEKRTPGGRFPLAQTELPWLLAVALSASLPHALHLPWKLSLIIGALFSWRIVLWRLARPLPSPWWLVLATALVCLAVWQEYRTLLGKEAGIATLALLMGLKLLEARQRRDGVVLVFLGWFMLITHYLTSQTLPVGLWMLMATSLLCAVLLRLHGAHVLPPRPTLKLGTKIVLQALPLMLVLFVFVPRLPGPLWGLPRDANQGRTGLSEHMTPGSLQELILSGEPAFRAHFKESTPPRDRLYWRGPVLEFYDGKTWRPHRHSEEESARPPGRSLAPHASFPPPDIQSQGPLIFYSLLLEPHQAHWALALDAPMASAALHNPGTELNSRLELRFRAPLRERKQLELQAALHYQFNRRERETILADNLELPDNAPRTLALAESWKPLSPSQRIQAALELFRREHFFYTLAPRELGPDPIDSFLFDTREGFCEYYASAFTILMRATGLPARVVTGYMGGERNPLDGHYLIRQSDAHAWAEVWLDNQGWVRVDPTAAVAPERILSNVAGALPASDLAGLALVNRPLPSWVHEWRHRWESVNYQWNQWVLSYTPQRQRELLQQWGLDSRRLAYGLWPVLLTFFALGALGWVWRWSRQPRLPAHERLWQQLGRDLARYGLERYPWEGPQDYAQRVGQARPELTHSIQAAAKAYTAIKYAPPASRSTLNEGRWLWNLRRSRQALRRKNFKSE